MEKLIGINKISIGDKAYDILNRKQVLRIGLDLNDICMIFRNWMRGIFIKLAENEHNC